MPRYDDAAAAARVLEDVMVAALPAHPAFTFKAGNHLSPIGFHAFSAQSLRKYLRMGQAVFKTPPSSACLAYACSYCGSASARKRSLFASAAVIAWP
jgi:hypothetical protein